MKYCLFAYKASSEDYCMGCHMASYQSDLIQEFDINKETLIEKLVDILSFQPKCVEEPFFLCYDCAYKLGWNGESYCVGQPKLRKEYKCDSCYKVLKREASDKYTWNSSHTMMMEHVIWQDILNARNNQ